MSTQYLQTKHSQATAGVNIDITNCWLVASPDGLVTEPTAANPNGLLEIKWPLQSQRQDTG